MLTANGSGLAFGRFLSVFGVVKLNQQKITAIVSKLLDWFSANARDLPWRCTRDSYAIWVSEIILQDIYRQVVSKP
jgi:adenine-specific DNA glycosylase